LALLKLIDNVKVGAKIDDFIMDDYNLSVKFDFEFDENIVYSILIIRSTIKYNIVLI